MRPRFGLALLVLAGALGSACDTRPAATPVSGPVSVTDHSGRTVVLSAPAQRIICLMPAVTDMLLALGASDRLIARTEFDTDPRLASLPSTRNALSPSLEWIAALKPDLVVAWPDQPSRSVVSRLSTLRIPVYGARTESIADVLRTTRDLGKLLGVPAIADSLARDLESQLERIRTAVSTRPRVRVAYVLSIDPPMVAGPATYISELIQIAGGENIFADVRALWPQVNLEEFIRRAPAALVIARERGTDPVPELQRLTGWRELSAVRRQRVRAVDPDLFNRAGPAMPHAARVLAEFLHPELPW